MIGNPFDRGWRYLDFRRRANRQPELLRAKLTASADRSHFTPVTIYRDRTFAGCGTLVSDTQNPEYVVTAAHLFHPDTDCYYEFEILSHSHEQRRTIAHASPTSDLTRDVAICYPGSRRKIHGFKTAEKWYFTADTINTKLVSTISGAQFSTFFRSSSEYDSVRAAYVFLYTKTILEGGYGESGSGYLGPDNQLFVLSGGISVTGWYGYLLSQTELAPLGDTNHFTTLASLPEPLEPAIPFEPNRDPELYEILDHYLDLQVELVKFVPQMRRVSLIIGGFLKEEEAKLNDLVDRMDTLEKRAKAEFDKVLAPTLACKLSMAASLVRRGRYREAEEIYRGALDQSPTDPDLMTGLAIIFAKQRRYDESEMILRSLLAIEEENSERDSSALLSPLENLSFVLIMRGQRAEGIALYRRLLREQKARHPQREIFPARDLQALSNSLYGTGQTLEAETAYCVGLDLCQELLKPDDPAIPWFAGNLALTLDVLGRHDEAEPYKRMMESLRTKDTDSRTSRTLVAASE